jgi:hypothetical protein
MAESSTEVRPVPSNTGNPRITVAFPFSKIDIRDPEPALTELATVVREIAEQVALLAHEVAPEQKATADRLVEKATRLSASLGAG